MLRTTFQSLFAVVALLGLASCAQKPVSRLEDARQYNVKFAAISGDTGVSPAIIVGVQHGIDDSIASTYRAVASPEVELNARLSNVETMQGPQGPIYVMKINTAVTNVRDGQLVSVGEFQVATAERSRKGIDITLRDSATSQLRYAYGLQPPMPRLMRPGNNNAMIYGPPMQDRMGGLNDPNMAPMTQEQMTERALQMPDPVLNSKSRIDTTNDPILAPGMASAQPDPAMVKPKSNKPQNGMGKNQMQAAMPAPNDFSKLTKDAAPAAASKDPVMQPTKPKDASAAPMQPEAPKLPPAKAYSNLENGAASKIAIPAKPKAPEPNVAQPATAPAAPVPAAEPAAAPNPMAPAEPCVVTVSNDCTAPAAK